jgi:hypothetical protein
MPSKIQTEILNEQQKKLLPLLRMFDGKFYLAGGTAIAWQLRHRRSVDFDLFTFDKIDQRRIRNLIVKNHHIAKTIIDDRDEYTVIVDGVKLTFLRYPFKIKPNKRFGGCVRMPDLTTLVALKAYALGRRAKWKDYVDLYWIMEKHCRIVDIIKKAKKIFGAEFNEKNFREQLAYFRDIDYTEEVDWLPDFKISDQQIKKALTKFSLMD